MPMGTSSLGHFAPDAFPILTAMANQLSSLDGIYPDLAFSKVKAFLQVEIQKSIAINALNFLERTSAVPAIRLDGVTMAGGVIEMRETSYWQDLLAGLSDN